jgi:hypothetical protein
MEGYALEPAGGLYAFAMNDQWWVFRIALANTTGTTKENLTGLLKSDRVPAKRKLPDLPVTLLATRDKLGVGSWDRLLSSYATLSVITGAKKAKRKPQKLTLIPLETAVHLVRRYKLNVAPEAFGAVEDFWATHGRTDQEEVKEPSSMPSRPKCRPLRVLSLYRPW